VSKAGDNDNLLRPYRQKRRSDATPEPFGRGGARGPGPLRFMVHHHAARNTHFDLRLEMEGVLRSWAVPKGPSPNVKDKRFAALVEDHPLEYGDFEGRIPDGNYGAGWTIVWDRGIWRPEGDPVAGLKAGKLLFELDGVKLHGMWTLVRMKSGDKDWLFIKETDPHADATLGTEDYPMNSVYSGQTIAELNAGKNPATRITRALARAGAVKRPIPLTAQKPMLASAGDAFDRAGWLFEIKYDGYRLICIKDGDSTRLVSRNGNDLSLTFPEIVLAVERLPYPSITLDGEAVCHDGAGLPSFARMQQRGRLNSMSAIDRAVAENPATLYAFDILAFGDYDLRDLALRQRKTFLRDALPLAGIIRFSDHIETEGRAMYQAAASLGLEGIVAKNGDARYRSGRSGEWIKVRIDQTDDFVIMGFRRGDNREIRSLIVGQYIDGQLAYSGNVGSGLNQKHTKILDTAFAALADVPRPDDGPDNSDLAWKVPHLVCEVRYKELTPAGQLRHPVFLCLRDDKDPQECSREAHTRELAELAIEPEAVDKTVHLSNTGKLFWPADGYSKGDMIEYYRLVSPWLLPWLADRPLVMTRYPDGIDGKSFFQKDAPEFVPDWIRIEKLWSDSTEREIGYFVVDCMEALLYIANMATIPLHVYHSRTSDLEHPDWCVLDLDPKEAPFKDVIRVAKAIHRLCDEIGLPNFVKTSGSTGLHILLPLRNRFTFEQSRVLGELLGRIVVHQLPDICTIVRSPAKRDGKVYIDYLQNGSGKLIASAYCVRPKPGAPVSMPIKWSEVTTRLRPDSYTIKNAITRLKRLKRDPAIDVLHTEVDLLAVLESLTGKFREIEAKRA
jgi:bifunctional non-homologous end joining protein LigD